MSNALELAHHVYRINMMASIYRKGPHSNFCRLCPVTSVGSDCRRNIYLYSLRLDTDFIASGGAGHHAWNVVRSEADNILFEHAGDSGAKVFDGVKVYTVQFAHQDTTEGFSGHDEDQVGRPVSASWSRKDGSTGDVRFEYLVDASGRAGLLATRYMKIRHYNQGLKSTATWGYWEGAGKYGEGTHREGDPYFEAIKGNAGTSSLRSIPLTGQQMEAGGRGLSHCTTTRHQLESS